MGRYVSGTEGFSYKYAFGRQGSNLGELAERSGVGQGGFGSTLRCQFVVPGGAPASDSFVDQIGPLSTILQARWPAAELLGTLGFSASSDLEFLIYDIADHWPQILAEVERRLPAEAAPSSLSLDAGASWRLRRDEWPALAAWIGHGVAPGEPATFDPAAEILWTSGERELLPLLALNALRHAVEQDLDLLELSDIDPVETNLWDVAMDGADRPSDDARWEDRAMYARLLHFGFRRPESAALFEGLLMERPTELAPALYLYAQRLWNDDWEGIATMASILLAAGAPHPALLHLWRGEARWLGQGPEAAREDADAAAALGDDRLIAALARPQDDEDDEDEDSAFD